LKLREDLRISVSLEVNLTAPNIATDQPSGRQLFKLTLHGADTGPYISRQFAQVKRFVCMA
jgi:hypothetical protein